MHQKNFSRQNLDLIFAQVIEYFGIFTLIQYMYVNKKSYYLPVNNFILKYINVDIFSLLEKEIHARYSITRRLLPIFFAFTGS